MFYVLGFTVAIITLLAYLTLSNSTLASRARLFTFSAGSVITLISIVNSHEAVLEYLRANYFCPWIMVFNAGSQDDLKANLAQSSHGCWHATNFNSFINSFIDVWSHLSNASFSPAILMALAVFFIIGTALSARGLKSKQVNTIV